MRDYSAGLETANLPKPQENQRRGIGVCPHIEQVLLVMELAGLNPDDFFCGWSTNYVSNIGFLSGREGTEYTPHRCCCVATLCLLGILSRESHEQAKEAIGCSCHIVSHPEISLAQMLANKGDLSELESIWRQILGFGWEELEREALMQMVVDCTRALLKSASSCPVRPRNQFFGFVS